MFAAGEDGTLELLARGPAPSQHKPVYGETPYYPVDPSASSTSNGACSSLNPYAGSYYFFAMTSQGYPIETPIIQPSVGTLSSTSSEAFAHRDSVEYYPEIKSSLLEPYH
jgi:hypothetical protein